MVKILHLLNHSFFAYELLYNIGSSKQRCVVRNGAAGAFGTSGIPFDGGKSVVVLRVDGSAPETLPQLVDGLTGDPITTLQLKWIDQKLCVKSTGMLFMLQ